MSRVGHQTNAIGHVGHGEGDPYDRFAPLLADALASLARIGLVVPPQDALDIVRDFFSEEWSKVQSRFDPAHPSGARFETYLYSAFLRFARKRIVRLRRWYGRLTDVLEIRDLAGPAESRESSRDLRRVREAIGALSEHHRSVLLAYLAPETTSERAVARQLGLTRYRLREALVEALGSAAVRIGEKGCISQRDWDVALSLWRDGRDPKSTACYLRREVSEVHASRQRIFELLARRGEPASRRNEKESRRMDKPLASLIEEAADRVGDEKLLDQLRLHATELGRLMRESERDDTSFAQLKESLDRFTEKSEKNPDWVARVFSTFAEPAAAEAAAIREQLAVVESREVQIAESFELLVADLSADLQLAPRLKHLKEVPQELRDALLARPFFEKTSDRSKALAHFGMSPVTVFRAARAVPDLAERIEHFKSAPGKDPFLLRRPGTSDEKDRTLEPTVYAEEISEVASCTLDAASILYLWLFEVSSVRPRVFFGCDSVFQGDRVQLEPRGEEAQRALELWASAPLRERAGDVALS